MRSNPETSNQPETVNRRSNAFVEDSGRGNNWALGYYGPRRGNGIVDRAMEAFRRQLEVSDAYRGSIIFHSLCGGTGAGLGSRLMEEMRDELPASPLVSTTVLPFSVGELPLQHYNATLCWSRVIQETDACFLFSNNDLLSLCAKRNAVKSGTTVRPADAAAAVVNTSHLNRCISLALASVLRPCVFGRAPKSKSAAPWDMSGAIAALCPTPESKVLEIWSVQESSKPHASVPPWASLGQRLAAEIPRFRNLPARDDCGPAHIRKISTAGYQVFARGAMAMSGGRGDEESGALAAREHLLKALDITPRWHAAGSHAPSARRDLGDAQHFVDATASGSWACCTQPLTATHARSLTLVASRSGHLSHLEVIHERCTLMLRSRAYLHWFCKYGFEEDEMTEALEHLHVYLEDASDFFRADT